jgi:hypothetical protein
VHECETPGASEINSWSSIFRSAGSRVRLVGVSDSTKRILRRLKLVGGVTLCLALGTGGTLFVYRYSVRPLPFRMPAMMAIPEIVNGEMTLKMPNGNLVGMVGEYDDELTAYLRLQYLKSLKPLAGREILMVSTAQASQPEFRLYVRMDNDEFAATRQLLDLRSQRMIPRFALESPPTQEIADWQKQTALFEAAYHGPVTERLIHLPPEQLHNAVAQFILFKVQTDPRVQRQLEPVVQTMTPEESSDFAADMIEVAKFYDVPLDMLLGIGAMENNYLDIRGDLQHAVWKRRAQRGDIVLKRRKGRVLVSNYSVGPWQITRETLRYAHALYLRDKRDYSKLPARLVPPRKLDLNHVDSHVLTTYAGLLLRNLLDYFHGDVQKAVGAYNGGRGRPNLEYAEGVTTVADYARRVLSMAAGRKGLAVSETPLQVVTPAPGQ